MKKLLFFLVLFLMAANFQPVLSQETEEEEEQTEEQPKKDKKNPKKDKEKKEQEVGDEEKEKEEVKEEEKKEPENDCPDPENETAVKLFKKYQDKKKYEYKERIAFLKQCLEEEPEYPQANYE